jgi:hypothetical protein
MVYAAVVLAHRRAGGPRLGALGLRSGTKWANVARMSASDMRGNAGPVARMSGGHSQRPDGFEVWGVSCRHGEISAQPRRRRNPSLYGRARGPPLYRPGRSCELAAHSVSRSTQERPFALDAIVILPDHLHAILTLPEGDANFAGRWRRIKGHFSTGLLVATYQPAREWRACTLAKAVLGTHHP